MKLKEFQIFALKFDLENPWLNQKRFFQDANSLPAALKTKV